MTPQRWAEVDRVLDEAMARPPQERAAFLSAAYQGDEELRREVESLLNIERGAAYPFWSPDGRRLGYSIIASQTYLIDPAKSWEQQTPFAVPLVNAEGHWFIGWSWSDGKRIAGWRGGKVGGEVRDLPGVFLYSLETQTYEQITEKIGRNPVWLKDSRHLLFTGNGALYLLDAQTKEPRVLMPRPHDAITTSCISPDNRRIYYTLSANEADLHLLTLEK